MKSISKLAITSAAIALAFISTASAQSMRVSIPFGFRAGQQSLPAGTYNVALSQQNGRVTLTQLEGNAGCFLFIKAYSHSDAPEQGTLVFHQYGNSYFLSRVNTAGVTSGAELFTSRAEQELAKVETHAKKVVVSASGI
jgi:hypothetical protein